MWLKFYRQPNELQEISEKRSALYHRFERTITLCVPFGSSESRNSYVPTTGKVVPQERSRGISAMVLARRKLLEHRENHIIKRFKSVAKLLAATSARVMDRDTKKSGHLERSSLSDSRCEGEAKQEGHRSVCGCHSCYGQERETTL